MRWVTGVTAPILLADVGDHCFGVFSLDLKRGDERIFGIHGDVVRLPFQFKPDGELHPHASSSHYFGADISRCPAHAEPRVAWLSDKHEFEAPKLNLSKCAAASG